MESTLDWSIRAASLEDVQPLARVFESYRVWYRKEPNQEGAIQFLSERLKNKESEIFVSEVNGEIVGFTQLYPLFSSTRMKRIWLLNDLFVDERHRGKGISVGLIDRAKQLVKDTGAFAMFLETEKTNTIGNQLYPRTGFELNTVSNYYEWVAS